MIIQKFMIIYISRFEAQECDGTTGVFTVLTVARGQGRTKDVSRKQFHIVLPKKTFRNLLCAIFHRKLQNLII